MSKASLDHEDPAEPKEPLGKLQQAWLSIAYITDPQNQHDVRWTLSKASKF